MQNKLLLASLRMNNKLSQQDLANILKVSLKTYKIYEAGVRPMSLEEINILANFYKVSLNSLVGLTRNTISYNTEEAIDYKYLRFSLRYVRKMRKVSQRELANYFNLTIPTICKYEKKPETVNLNYLVMFGERFGVSLDYICGKTLKRDIF